MTTLDNESEARELVDFDLREKIKNPLIKYLYSVVAQSVEKFLAIEDLNRAYAEVQPRVIDNNPFDAFLEKLNVQYDVSESDLKKIPREGPVIVVANHPYGGVDGLILGSILTRVRTDTRLLVNYLLERVRELQPWVFTVDPFGGGDALRENIQPLKQTLKWLKAGGCLGTFPAGEVSHIDLRSFQVKDSAWSINTARLVRRSQSTVVPVYFEGANSTLFQILGLIHPRLRTALLPRELINKNESNIKVLIGAPIPFKRLDNLQSDVDLNELMRLKTYYLRNRYSLRPRVSFTSWGQGQYQRNKPPVLAKALATPQKREILKNEIECLSEEKVLVEYGQFTVYLAQADQIPHLLNEIGRLREETFRQVNEGTGKSRDLDAFDSYYQHLFMWDHQSHAIVGAYRLGLTDKIFSKVGGRGLYTSTLFQFKSTFLEQINPGLELGRSFICAQYQRKHASLALLWRGIGAFIVRHPQYKILFGPVSINREYQTISKDLMVQFLKDNKMDSRLSRYVKAKNPPVLSQLKGPEREVTRTLIKDIEDVSTMVTEIEFGGKGIPVLLRHYIKLNARLLGFNIDPDFNDALDGLMLVDVTQVERKILKNYMGPEGYHSFCKYHHMVT